MKKGIKIAFLGTVLAIMCGFGLAQQKATVVFAEGEEPETSEPAPESSEPEEISESEEPVVINNAQIIIEQSNHGKIKADIEEGNAGDVCKLTVEPDLFYLIDNVSVNGVALIESETIRGEYSFVLVEGENKVTVKFVIDEELLGKLSGIVEEASNKDWTNLFTVKNVVTIVAWLLDGGLLIAVIRYFVKDKKLEEKLEKNTKESLEKLVPQQTKEAVSECVEKTITPIFAQVQAHMVEIEQAMNVFAKCFALSQENTPESRKAILDELTSLKIGDLKLIDSVKTYIENLVAEQKKNYQETLDAIKEIGLKNQQVLDETKEEEPVEKVNDNGTQI